MDERINRLTELKVLLSVCLQADPHMTPHTRRAIKRAFRFVQMDIGNYKAVLQRETQGADSRAKPEGFDSES